MLVMVFVIIGMRGLIPGSARVFLLAERVLHSSLFVIPTFF